MKFQNLFSIMLAAVLIGNLSAADPVVSNPTAAQRVGTKLVDITNDVTAGAPTAIISLEISSDGGTSFSVPVFNHKWNSTPANNLESYPRAMNHPNR